MHADKCAASPYRPAGHGVHAADPAVLNVPTGHAYDVALVEPGPQAYPAKHGPLHWLVTCLTEKP